jgi:hypothetical protein
MRGRRAGWPGIAFVVLLLLQAGMADIPTLDTPIARIQRFYANHGGIIVVAQVIAIVASAVFLLFVWTVAVQLASGSALPRLRASGVLVAAASVATAVPPLLLALANAPSTSTAHALTRAADVTDAILFAAIALFASELARDVVIGWLRAVALVVAVFAVARLILGLAEITALDVVAPMVFLAFALVLSIEAFRGGQPMIGQGTLRDTRA